MQDKMVYEYAVLRIVPRVERGEFVNVGVIMMCKLKRFLKIQYTLNEQRLLAFWPTLNIRFVQQQIEAFAIVCEGGKAAAEIGELPLHERFRWLTAHRSTIIQCAPVHGGITQDLEQCFTLLFREYVVVPEAENID
jgi:hypothetical protein